MDILDRFEMAWRQGPRPDISRYLPSDGSHRLSALIGLVHIDLERRLHQGEMACVEAYLGRFPELAATSEVLLDLIAAEFHLRLPLTPRPLRDEYQRRFPHLADRLRERLGPASPAGALTSPTQTHPRSPGLDCAPVTHETTTIPPQPPAHESSDATIDSQPSWNSFAEEALDHPAIPGYEIVSKLGEGGMGVVYKARHLRLNRRVALKMVKASHGARPEELVRFLGEAEAVARLQHPHIVQVYETGEHQGLPYFTMELIEGGSLQQKAAGAPQAPGEAAQLTALLARAVHAVHQVGIVHRDLKPSNVLLAPGSGSSTIRDAKDSTLNSRPGDRISMNGLCPKLTDFGLAKWLEIDKGLTQTGVVLGTPSYMPPEQAEGRQREVGPAADIYSLGAVLYDLLTGRPPFKGVSHRGTIVQLLYDDPVAPRTLQPAVPRDLETICLKCLEKQPSHRYFSAQALAEDLECFLQGRPILARPITVWGRAMKWAKRRPAVASLCGLLLAVVSGGLITLTALWQRAEHQRDRAERYRGQTLQAGDVFFEQLLESPEMRFAGAESFRRKLLEKGVGFFDSLLAQGESTGAPEKFRRGREWFLLANLQKELGQYSEAEPNFQNAREVFEELARADPADLTYVRNRAAVLNNLGILYRRTGRLEMSQETLEQALEIKTALTQERPENVGYRFDLAKTLGNLGDLYSDPPPAWTDFFKARDHYGRALKILQELIAEEPANLDYETDLGTTYNDLGYIFRQEGKMEAARDHFEKARKVREALWKAQPDNPVFLNDLSVTTNNLGDLYQEQDKLKDAERAYRLASQLGTELKNKHPKLRENLVRLSATQYNLANLLKDQGTPEALQESVGLYRQAIPQLETAIKEDPRNRDARDYLYLLSWGQVSTLARTTEFAGAIVQAEALGKSAEGPPGENLRNLACVYALAVSGADRHAPAANRNKLMEQYAARAVQLLGQARDGGLFRNSQKLGELKDDPDLKVLHGRRDYQELIKDLDKLKPPKKA